MKNITWYVIAFSLLLALTACGTTKDTASTVTEVEEQELEGNEVKEVEEATSEVLNNEEITIPSNYDIQQLIMEHRSGKEIDMIDFALNDISEDEIQVTIQERREQNDEILILDVHYHLTREGDQWLVADVEESDSNTDSRRQVSQTLNEQFFGGNHQPDSDRIRLINFFDTAIPQVLTIQQEGERSVVRVFDYDSNADQWNSIYENKDHDTTGGIHPLLVFDSAPMAVDSTNEQAIVGFQREGVISLYFYILGEIDREIDVIFDGMELGARGSIFAENQDIVISNYDFDLEKDIELARFRINQQGEPVYGSYIWNFPVTVEASTTYTNDQYNFSIQFPDSFAQSYFVRETNADWFTRGATEVPITMYAFGMGHDGKYVGDIFSLAVFEGNQTDIDPQLLEGPFHQAVASKDGLTLVAIFPSELDARLYEEPYLELGNKLGNMTTDVFQKLPDLIQFN